VSKYEESNHNSLVVVQAPEFKDLYNTLGRNLAVHCNLNVVLCELRLSMLGLLKLADSSNDIGKL
jgi:hypothetical protein